MVYFFYFLFRFVGFNCSVVIMFPTIFYYRPTLLMCPQKTFYFICQVRKMFRKACSLTTRNYPGHNVDFRLLELRFFSGTTYMVLKGFSKKVHFLWRLADMRDDTLNAI